MVNKTTAVQIPISLYNINIIIIVTITEKNHKFLRLPKMDLRFLDINDSGKGTFIIELIKLFVILKIILKTI